MISGQHEDGTKYWQFEESELEARRKFEQSILDVELDDLFSALIIAVAKRNQAKAEAWQQVKKMILEKFGDDPDHLSYNWLIGRITAQKED